MHFSLDIIAVSRYNDYVEYEMKGFVMAYEYSLNDLYVMFRQAETNDDRLALVREWKEMNLPYDIKWEAIENTLNKN